MKRTDIYKVVEKAEDWTELQKLLAASEIRGFLTREACSFLDPSKWEFVPTKEGKYLRGLSPLCTFLGAHRAL
jgi:hypothetical protein